MLDPGCEIILSDPHYACYPNFVRFLGGVPVFIPVVPDNGFLMEPDDVERAVTERTRAIIVNSPCNPTGTIMDPDRMKRIAQIGIPIISDEIYHGLVYEGHEHSMLEFTRNTFTINGFSKLYAMTGWRLGYMIVPPELVRPLQKMGQNFFISAADFAQYAGVEALTNSSDETRVMKEAFNKRRLAMIPRLKELGFDIRVDPTAAFYILADARRYSGDSYKFAFDILENAGRGSSARYRLRRQCRRFHTVFLHELTGEHPSRIGPDRCLSQGVLLRRLSVRRAEHRSTADALIVLLYASGDRCFEDGKRQVKTRRLFVSPDDVSGGEVFFSPKATHYLTRVLRLKPGDEVEVLDGTQQLIVRIDSTHGGSVKGKVLQSDAAPERKEPHVTLAFGSVRPGPFQEILRHGTEIGVSCFVPVISERVTRRPDHRKDRWQSVIASASAQSPQAALT